MGGSFRLMYWTKDDQAISFVDEKNEIEAQMSSEVLIRLMKEDFRVKANSTEIIEMV
jgi:hypothetical protein